MSYNEANCIFAASKKGRIEGITSRMSVAGTKNLK